MNSRIVAPAPDVKEYEHLSEKERMLAGYPYKPFDAELTRDRLHVRRLIRQYNSSEIDEEDKRQELLKSILHPSCKDKKVFIEPNFRVDYGYNIVVGNNLQMNFDCVILDCARVTIGDNCLMAPGVHIYAATHPLEAQYRKDDENYYELAKPVTIGNNCWLGGHCTIVPGVVIGDNVVVGAGSVVTKDVPSNVVVAGNPAKIIRYLEGAVLPESN
ncbi:Maltose O-acetyltransferase [Pseudolycoriella hygida]|uniref:Maltose O-acetyltransferase n=1 Tax=Pseudolycoriella hygida TaxID=35572 RepID=A0A9Q0MPL5_9DIPT|nr:Maltose O-acetyltransferase [Pseudolycoriella hygida]